MQSTNPPLDPCPFCGGSVYWCKNGDADIEPHICHMIQCPKCGEFDVGKQANDVDDYDAMLEKIAEIWNRRCG